MKRLGRVFDEIISAANLWAAWLDFRRGKRRRPSVLRFERQAETHVLRLHRALQSGSYQPAGYRTRLLRKPKKRLIAAAPVQDRVVHHAVHRVLAPVLDRSLLEHTYACLPGRGTHRAAIRFLRGLREHPYVLLLDIRHYFLSIDHRILMRLMERRIKDARLLDLLERIARSGAGLYRAPDIARALALPPGFPPDGCGLPIGNLTSQWWGNHYLSGLDHFVKRRLRIPHAQRYMDDMALFADNRRTLRQAHTEVDTWLAYERRLSLKDAWAPVRSTREMFRYLGLRISRAGIEPGAAMLARLRGCVGELLYRADMCAEQSMTARVGHWLPIACR